MLYFCNRRMLNRIRKRLVRFLFRRPYARGDIYFKRTRDEKWGLWEIYQYARRLVVSCTRVFPCSGVKVPVQTEVPPGWYTTLWALARYAGTKRLNEHLRTPRQSRVNRTWLILSRKICGGRLPRGWLLFFLPPFFSYPSFFFHNATANTRDERSCRGSQAISNFRYGETDKSEYAAPFALTLTVMRSWCVCLTFHHLSARDSLICFFFFLHPGKSRP